MQGGARRTVREAEAGLERHQRRQVVDGDHVQRPRAALCPTTTTATQQSKAEASYDVSEGAADTDH
mgnify:CR=1 FL=1